MFPARALRKREHLSEEALAARAGLSRSGLRSVQDRAATTLSSVASVATALNRQACLLAMGGDANSECSSLAVGLMVLRDGDDSWKLHFMDLVDEFRRTLDTSLILLAPPRGLSAHLGALQSSIVVALADEANVDAPPWAREPHWLTSPWFISGVESLKATALVESSLAFRRNNIFVQGNFMSRA
jgi:hypothetical protein